MIRLQTEAWSATVSPALGGAILDLEHAGRPIFRPSPPDAAAILETACFPLVPYANRIAGGRFRCGDEEITLPVLPEFAPHALHGDGWLRAWNVEHQDQGSVSLTLRGGNDHWPWAWSATQTIRLSGAGLRVDLSMTNEADRSAPAGLGLHPYFHRLPDTRLTLAADRVWLTGADEIPERLAASSSLMDWSGGAALASAPPVDHAYEMRRSEASLEDRSHRTVLSASDNCRWAQVYATPGGDFVCIEPVTHRPDAVNAPIGEDTGLAILSPGESLSIWMTIGVATAQT
ncbi:MAG: aldose 1-epimerase [Brevundimonas sp.]